MPPDYLPQRLGDLKINLIYHTIYIKLVDNLM